MQDQERSRFSPTSSSSTSEIIGHVGSASVPLQLRASSRGAGAGAGAGKGLGPSRLQMAVSHRQRKPPEPLRRAVADCLSASHHVSVPLTSEAVRTLQDYLANPSTIHFAYTVLLEHALAERERSPPVVMKCVSLLKRYLFRYVPPISTLQQIDTFCAGLIAESSARTSRMVPVTPPQPFSITSSVFASEALSKSLNYVRAVVSRHMPGLSLKQQTSFAGNTNSLKSVPLLSPRGRIFSHSTETDLRRSDKQSAVTAIFGETIQDESLEFIVVDVLKWRWINTKGKRAWMPSPVMMDSGGIARPQVEMLDNLDGGAAALLLERTPGMVSFDGKRKVGPDDKFLRASTTTTVGDSAVMASHLRAVTASKRLKHLHWDGETQLNTVKKRPRPLFHYRCYSKQQPLRLSDAEIEEVIAAVCSDGVISGSSALSLVPSLPNNHESSDVAASVLIKLLIDMYMADSRAAAPLALSILQGMLSSGFVAVRIRAFDLVLNLGIHAHLLEPFQNEEQEAVPLFEGAASADAAARPFRPGDGSQAVDDFETWLLVILCEMLLFLLQLEEKEEGVWAAAMSTLFYYVCDRGRIRRKRLDRVDIRVMKMLLVVSRENEWPAELHSTIIRMLSNLLYVSSSVGAGTVFDLEKLEMLGGIQAICEEYSLVNNTEAKRNLFAVIFDFLVLQVRYNKGVRIPGQDEFQAVATSLDLAGAPESVSIAFEQGIHGIGGKLAKSIFKALDRDVANGRLNATLLEEITGSIDMLVEKQTSLDNEFQSLMTVTMGENEQDEMVVRRGWATVHSLLHSSRSDYRRHGCIWLVKLLANEIKCGQTKHNQGWSFLNIVEPGEGGDLSWAVHLFFGLLKSSQHYVRREFLYVLKRLLSHCRNLVQESGADEAAITLVKLMNGALWQFISANDTHRVNVLQMCSLMFSEICVRWRPQCGNPSKLMEGDDDDDDGDDDDDDDDSHGDGVDDDDGGDDDGDDKRRKRKKKKKKRWAKDVSSSFHGKKTSSVPALLLREEAAASKPLIATMPTTLLYWPLMQLAVATMDDVTLGIAVGSKGGANIPGGASDVRAALLLLLIGKCTLQQAALEEVGGEEFFRSLLDDDDARISYYTASFLLKQMMVEEPDKYQRVLHNLVFKAQQSNNEKLLENPYLQMRGILQLTTDIKADDSNNSNSNNNHHFSQ